MTNDAGRALRIGCVKYLNARPLIDGAPWPVVFDEPAKLSAQLAAGELDIALVSSFEFLRNPNYAIVDDIAIASDGEVFSVIVVAYEPLEELKAIELDPASLTSVNLLRCLLSERGLTTPFVARPSAPDSPLPPHTGRLLIGDQAVRFRAKLSSEMRIYDLGKMWRDVTGLPFVYALWLVRPEVPNASAIATQLRNIRDRNLTRLEHLVRSQNPSAPPSSFSSEPVFAHRYWTHHLRFTFREREKSGLLRFAQLCEKHGILPHRERTLTLL